MRSNMNILKSFQTPSHTHIYLHIQVNQLLNIRIQVKRLVSHYFGYSRTAL